MIEIRELQDGDLEYVRQNPLEDAVKNYPEMHPQKPSYTGLIDGKIVGVGGVTVLWEGVGEGWLILTKDVLKHKTTAYNCIYRMTKKIIEECNLTRIQAVVRVDFPQAMKMMERLGFRREGYLRKYCPDGCNVWLYGRVK